MRKIEELIRKIYELEAELPEQLLKALEDVENDDVQGTDADALNILGNYNPEDEELAQLIEELYDLVLLRAEIWEFARSLERGVPARGPTLEVRIGRVEPVWDGETLSMQGVDEYLHAELITFDDPDPDMIVEEIDEYRGL